MGLGCSQCCQWLRHFQRENRELQALSFFFLFDAFWTFLSDLILKHTTCLSGQSDFQVLLHSQSLYIDDIWRISFPSKASAVTLQARLSESHILSLLLFTYTSHLLLYMLFNYLLLVLIKRLPLLASLPSSHIYFISFVQLLPPVLPPPSLCVAVLCLSSSLIHCIIDLTSLCMSGPNPY